MRILLHGHLNWYDEQKRTQLEMEILMTTRLIDLVTRLGIPAAEIAVVLVNNQPAVLANAVLENGDQVELFPPVSGG